jgi:hypothetical protein
MSNEPQVSPQELAQRFAQLVMMQAQNILYLLGRLPGPHGETAPPQLPEAKMLIDQLEMLQAKTKGNLSAQEQKLLDNSVTQMRLAFVEASGGTSPAMMPNPIGFNEDFYPPEEEEFSAVPPAEASQPTPAAAAPADAPKPEPAEDKKKYFKSYG